MTLSAAEAATKARELTEVYPCVKAQFARDERRKQRIAELGVDCPGRTDARCPGLMAARARNKGKPAIATQDDCEECLVNLEHAQRMGRCRRELGLHTSPLELSVAEQEADASVAKEATMCDCCQQEDIDAAVKAAMK